MSVYFIQAGFGGPVKIGFTREAPEKRVAQLLTAHYEALHLRRVVDGGQEVERWLHSRFAPHHLRGEWFSYVEDMDTVEIPGNLPDGKKTEIIAHAMTTRNFSVTADAFGVSREYVRQIANKYEQGGGTRLHRGKAPRKKPCPQLAEGGEV